MHLLPHLCSSEKNGIRFHFDELNMEKSFVILEKMNLVWGKDLAFLDLSYACNNFNDRFYFPWMVTSKENLSHRSISAFTGI